MMYYLCWSQLDEHDNEIECGRLYSKNENPHELIKIFKDQKDAGLKIWNVKLLKVESIENIAI